MNWAALVSSLLPYLLQLLSDPAFQTVIKTINDQLQKKVASGVPSSVANDHAAGQLGAAAMLHLTGNPIADVQAFLANFKPPGPGGYTS